MRLGIGGIAIVAVVGLLMGKNPLHREAIHQSMRLLTRTVSYRVVGAVDTALWDLAGKIANLPVHALMGTCRTSIMGYASSQVLPDVAAYVDQAQAFKAAGWKAYKIHPPRVPEKDIEVCVAVRKAVGDILSVLGVDDVIAPLFVREGIDRPEPIVSLPGVVQHTRESLRQEVRELIDLGVKAVILFGVPSKKDPLGSAAWDPNGIVQVALQELRSDFGDSAVLMADCCLDEYTSHVREIERRIRRSEQQASAQPDLPDAPVGVPESYDEHVTLLFDLLALMERYRQRKAVWRLFMRPAAETLRAALGQAAAQPDIRQDVVDRMRELMDRGEVGSDPHKLADAIIDGWLSTPPGNK